MFKKIWSVANSIIGRLAFTFLWLIALGAIAEELSDLPAIALGIVAMVVFFVYHVKLAKPKGWDRGRLQFAMPHHLGLLVLLSLLLVVGDAFWIFHVKTSADTFTDEALDFTVLAVIAFPLVEEFGFRLWLQGYLEEKIHPYLAVLLVAVIFASFHKPTMPIPQLLSGILYGVILLETKSIWIPVLLHALHNAILVGADKIEVIQELGYIQMDKPGNMNLYIAIASWLLSAAGITLWVKWSRRISLPISD